MARQDDFEFQQWAEQNNFSEADLQLIKSTARNHTLLWFLTSLIPGVHLVTFSLMNIAWVQYKVIKQRTFNVRPGLLLTLASVVLFVNFIFIIPAIVYFVGRKRLWGSGIRGLMKNGRIGTGN